MPLSAAVAMDVDGTLAGADHVVSRRTGDAVRQLASHGVTAIIVTGRTERSARALAMSLGLTAPIIACNGAVITDPVSGERLQVHAIGRADAERARSTAGAHGCQPLFFTVDRPCAGYESSHTRLLSRLLDEPVAIGSLEEVIARETIVKVMIAGDPMLLDTVGGALEATIPGLERSMPQFYEAAPPGASKREALGHVLARLGIAPEDCVGIGDGGNDVGWLSSVGRAVAVQNARPAVLAIADEVIGHHADDGVAVYLESTFLRSGEHSDGQAQGAAEDGTAPTGPALC